MLAFGFIDLTLGFAEMVTLTAAICWELVAKTKDPVTGVGVAIFHKPTTNFCYENRKQSSPPLCDDDDKADAAWYYLCFNSSIN